MARSQRLPEIAEAYGEPLEELIPRMVEEQGSLLRAAMKLEVAPNTLRWWVQRNGYEIKVGARLVKVDAAETEEA